MCRGDLEKSLGNVTYYGKVMGGNERLGSGKKNARFQ
jgi:hypothetical protein